MGRGVTASLNSSLLYERINLFVLNFSNMRHNLNNQREPPIACVPIPCMSAMTVHIRTKQLLVDRSIHGTNFKTNAHMDMDSA